MKKKLIITNLKECFKAGICFKDLAVVEKYVNEQKTIDALINVNGFHFYFQNATINQDMIETFYYQYNVPF
jgi:hypothetical protein